MLMSVVLAVGYLQPMSVYATEDAVTDESEVEVTDPTANDDSSSDNKSEKKKKKKDNTETRQEETAPAVQEEALNEETEPEQVITAAEPVQVVVLPEEQGISEEDFDQMYGVSWNQTGEVSDINRSALNNVILYEEGMTDVWMIRGQMLELPEEGWTCQTLEGKKYVTFKKKTVKARKVTTNDPIVIMSGGDHSRKLNVHIYLPYMQGGALTLGEGETAEISFNYDKDHFDAAWYSSNPNILSVSGNKVTALSKGTATVDVYVGGQKYSKKVKVESVSKITDFSSSIDLTVGQSVKVKFKDVKKKVQWSIVSENVAGSVSLSNKGKLTGVKPGVAKIQAVDKNGTTKTLTVNVKVPEKEIYLEPGKSKTVKLYKVKNADAVWTPADKNIATVNEKGKITAGAVSGNTVITCTYKDVEYKINVYVEKPEFATDEFLTLADGQYSIDVEEGTYYTLVPVGIYQDIEYKSSNTSVAFVDEFGRLQGRKAGNNASITATIGKKKINIKVVVRNRRKIELPEKYVNVLDYGAVPYDGIADEDAFNAALAAAAASPEMNYTVYVPEGYYNIDVNKAPEAIKIRGNNVKLIMDPMAVLHVNDTARVEYSVISIKESSNVLVQGGQVEGGRSRHIGTTEGLNQGGYGVVAGTYSEYVEIRDMRIYDCWSDGIYIYSSNKDDLPNNIKIINCELYNNRRNNIGVIGVDDLLIEDCMIESADGTPPMAGVDIEPNRWFEGENGYFKCDCTNIKIKNCIMSTPEGRSCTTDQKSGFGIYYSFMVLRGAQTVVADTIELDGCIFNGDVDSGDSSKFVFKNCTINGTLYYDKNKKPALQNCKVKKKQEY